MKFTVERLWLDAAWNCTDKPKYGMRNLDGILEERVSIKLELAGPLVDGYLRELGKAITAKLGRSRNTGLMPPVKLFVPYMIFRHLCTLAVGYGGNLNASSKSTLIVTVESYETASKLFSPVRSQGNSVLKKRHFDKVRENDRTLLKYSGRAAVVGQRTPIMMFEYNMKQEKLTFTFYIQRYNSIQIMNVYECYGKNIFTR